MDRMLSLIWERVFACVWRIIDRKSGRRSRGRRVLLSISGCIVGMSRVCAHVIRLEVLFSMGSRRGRGFAVPGPHGTCECFVKPVSSNCV